MWKWLNTFWRSDDAGIQAPEAFKDDAATLGQVAYNAYCQTTEWHSAVTGAPLPLWHDVNPLVRKAWEAAALAVSRQAWFKGIDAARKLDAVSGLSK
jgi:hypothetical protein